MGLAFAAAEAKESYSTVSPKLLRSERENPALQLSVRLFSPVTNVNAGAIGVIKQGGRVLHAIRREVKDERVVDTPEAGYRQTIVFDFDMRRFKPNAPFAFVIANIPIASLNEPLRSGEVACSYDGTTFP
jgi:hypothetical protein